MPHPAEYLALKLANACIDRPRDEAWGLLQAHFKTKFANKMIAQIEMFTRLTQDPHFDKDEHSTAAVLQQMVRVMHLKFVSVQLVDSLEELAQQPEGDERRALTTELQNAQQQLAGHLKDAYEDVALDIRELRQRVQLARNEHEQAEAAAQIAQQEAGLPVAPDVARMAEASLESARSVLEGLAVR